MSTVSEIGSLLKKAHRLYTFELLEELQAKGFLDLRPSFLEILMFICENDAPSIKSVGESCGLKKQTMTSHLNELEKRGYTIRKPGLKDKRELKVHLTDYGEKFKIQLLEVASTIEGRYLELVGEVEVDRLFHLLRNFLSKVQEDDKQQELI